MRSPLYDLALMCVAFAGFVIAFYIYHRKHEKKPLVCPLRSNCETVITSKYSHFLGIPIEFLGMTYYGGVFLIHAFMLAMPALATTTELRLGLAASTLAFFFSLYLISLQAFVLKQWCTWCLTSATLCVLIFFITLASSPIPRALFIFH